MRIYRGPAIIGLAVAALTLLVWVPRYGLDMPGILGAALNGAIVYAVASVALWTWRRFRGRPVSRS